MLKNSVFLFYFAGVHVSSWSKTSTTIEQKFQMTSTRMKWKSALNSLGFLSRGRGAESQATSMKLSARCHSGQAHTLIRPLDAPSGRTQSCVTVTEPFPSFRLTWSGSKKRNKHVTLTWRPSPRNTMKIEFFQFPVKVRPYLYFEMGLHILDLGFAESAPILRANFSSDTYSDGWITRRLKEKMGRQIILLRMKENLRAVLRFDRHQSADHDVPAWVFTERQPKKLSYSSSGPNNSSFQNEGEHQQHHETTNTVSPQSASPRLSWRWHACGFLASCSSRWSRWPSRSEAEVWSWPRRSSLHRFDAAPQHALPWKWGRCLARSAIREPWFFSSVQAAGLG